MSGLIFVKPRFEVYKAVSQQIREIFEEHTPVRGKSGVPTLNEVHPPARLVPKRSGC
jgi:hypothetical protein